MNSILARVLLFVLIIGAVRSQFSTLDISGTDLETTTASSALACAALCDNSADCVGWLWDSCGEVDCWLKSEITSRSTTTCRVSSPKLGQVGVTTSGLSLPGMPITLAAKSTAATCAAKCYNTTGCVSWSFDTCGTLACTLMSTSGAASTSSCATSGVQGQISLNWNGGNLPKSPLTLAANASSTTCARECDATAGCVAWTFTSPLASCGTTNLCHLMAYIGSPLGKVNQTCTYAGRSVNYYNGNATAVVTVASVVALGNQSDPGNAPQYPSRDCGYPGNVGGEILWFYCDTDWFDGTTFESLVGNSGAVGTYGNPLIVNGPKGYQAIPFTSTESAFNTEYFASENIRVVLWPGTGVVEIYPGYGLLYLPKAYYNQTLNGGYDGPDQGTLVVAITLAGDGNPVATRFNNLPLFPSASILAYGTFAATRDDEYLYLYGAKAVSGTYYAWVARVALDLANASATANSYADFTFWNGAAWESTPPAYTAATAAINCGASDVEGSIFFSSYLKQWVLTYQVPDSNAFYMMHSAKPQGPWSAGQWLYDSDIASEKPVYTTSGTNLYDLTGKTSSGKYTWTADTTQHYYEWTVQFNFA